MSATPRWSQPVAIVGLCVSIAILCWAYWPAYVDVYLQWSDPQYSHGYLVPIFALLMLYLRREQLAHVKLDIYGAGIPVLLLASGLRYFENFHFGLEYLENASLLVFLAGLAILFGGWPALRWSGPSILFLVFMIPLPWDVSVRFAIQLQQIATATSTYILQTIGLVALPDGNRIIVNRGEHLDEKVLLVEEACSGLRMMLIFFALSTAVVFFMRGSWWEKTIVFLSAVPIALISNITRIVVTGLLYVYTDDNIAHDFYHDWAGWLMMPFALMLLWLELQIMAKLFVEARRREPAGLPLFGVPPFKRA